jgi:DNA mismatch repair protein MutL
VFFDDTNDTLKKYIEKESIPQINYTIIGQLFETYILIECQNELLIIDQHATHERMLYDSILKQNSNNIVVQDLLFPYIINIDDDKIEFINTHIEIFKNLCFDFEIKNNKLKLKSIPYILINMDVEYFIKELLEESENLDKLSDIVIIREKIATMACKKAIKGGDKLNNEQLDYVIKYFFKSGMPLQCPHGRPTISKFTKVEIEKMFRRIV